MNSSQTFHPAIIVIAEIDVSRMFYTEVPGRRIRDDFRRSLVLHYGLGL